MKKWAYLLILFFVLAICRSANSEILIYNINVTDEKSFLKNGSLSTVTDGKGREKGYLILDVGFDPTSINNAVQITYYEVANKKVYIHIPHDFEIQIFWSGGEWWFGGSPYWALTNIHSPNEEETVAMMLSGKPRMTNIGSGSGRNRKRVPKTLEGTYFVSVAFSWNGENIDYKIMQTVSLKLNTQITKQANSYWSDYEQAGGVGFDYTPFEWAVGGVDQADDIYGIVTAKLELSGYHEPDPNSINIDLWSL